MSAPRPTLEMLMDHYAMLLHEHNWERDDAEQYTGDDGWSYALVPAPLLPESALEDATPETRAFFERQAGAVLVRDERFAQWAMTAERMEELREYFENPTEDD